MTQQEDTESVVTLTIEEQASTTGGDSGFTYDFTHAVTTIAFLVGQAGILLDRADRGAPIGYAPAFGFF